MIPSATRSSRDGPCAEGTWLHAAPAPKGCNVARKPAPQQYSDTLPGRIRGSNPCRIDPDGGIGLCRMLLEVAAADDACRARPTPSIPAAHHIGGMCRAAPVAPEAAFMQPRDLANGARTLEELGHRVDGQSSWGRCRGQFVFGAGSERRRHRRPARYQTPTATPPAPARSATGLLAKRSSMD